MHIFTHYPFFLNSFTYYLMYTSNMIGVMHNHHSSIHMTKKKLKTGALRKPRDRVLNKLNELYFFRHACPLIWVGEIIKPQ